MAKAIAIRLRPRTFGSSLETVNQDASPGGGGARVEIMQLVVYDNTKVGPGSSNPYVPGSPASEQFIFPVRNEVCILPHSAFAGKTDIEAKAIWTAERDRWIAAWQAMPDIAAQIQNAWGAANVDLVLY